MTGGLVEENPPGNPCPPPPVPAHPVPGGLSLTRPQPPACPHRHAFIPRLVGLHTWVPSGSVCRRTPTRSTGQAPIRV
ncbi:hypothetical protein DPEC_G00277300 [Dallia pectoralis]|uniref:Uncharacterized protein n=1 Tax=Dallia pectoralis TaxID=75939 RepID=A0ACC2FLQ8_DALPE|nr:hypothetical protein DPEC_G00277300 [Dallia pectoralis]